MGTRGYHLGTLRTLQAIKESFILEFDTFWVWGEYMYFGHSHDLSVPLLEEILMGAWSSGSCQGVFSLGSLSPFRGRSAVYLACARTVIGGALAIPLVVVELPPHFQS